MVASDSSLPDRDGRPVSHRIEAVRQPFSRPPHRRLACPGPYSRLEPRLALATVEVIAAGTTGAEAVDLLIAGQIVHSWTGVGNGAGQGDFVTLSHTTAGPVSAADVRLAFTNDLYDPASGIDRNLRIDAVRIDGVRYETEAASVWSTGTWKAADGIVPGFRESEFLHSGGEFQFAAGPDNSGSELRLRAWGDEAAETMELRVNGVAVASFHVTAAPVEYIWRANGTVNAGQVEVAFVNDQYDPANLIDRNLHVDWLQVDGLTLQTESPTTWSTGTWLPADGIQPGYRQSETLHSIGEFRFGLAPQFGAIRLENNVIRIHESAGQTPVTFVRTGGSDGEVSVAWRTVAISATAGADFTAASGRVTFLPGQTSRTLFVTIANDALAEPDEQFSVTIDNALGGATLLSPRTATIIIEDNDAVRASGTGLLGEYYDDATLVTRFSSRVDPNVNFNWGSGAPVAGMGVNTFSVRWTGRIEATSTATWTFRTVTDDGVRLWVDGRLLIDRWRNQTATAYTATISLERARLYDIRLEYFDNTGSASAALQWSSPGQTLQVIPKSQLHPAAPPGSGPGSELRTENLFTGLDGPTAIDFSADGRNLYIAEFRGAVRIVRDGVLSPQPLLDISDHVNGIRGLVDIAVHPDLASHPYLYLTYTYDPPEVFGQAAGSLAGPDGRGNRAGRMTRVTLDATTGFTAVVPGSETVLVGTNSTWPNFNAFVDSTVDFSEPPAGVLPGGGNLRDFVATDTDGHFIDSVEFGPDGMLYVSVGDGASYNQVDPRAARVQDIDNLSGKIMRIDPLTGLGLADNPFFDGDPGSNRSRVWQYGLRNPYRFTFDPLAGRSYVGDVGWSQWEEVDSAGPGANFGWPWYEGGDGANQRTIGYQDLPAAQAFYAGGTPVTPSLFGLNHAATGIDAIIMGDFVEGGAWPAQYEGNLFYGELASGIIHNVRLNADGTVAETGTFATGHHYVIQMVCGPDGNLYFVDLDDNTVGRWVFSGNDQAAQASSSVATGAPVSLFSPPISAGSGVVVAVVDSGLNTSLPEFAGRLWQNPAEIAGDGVDNDGNGLVDDVHGYDFVADTGELSDPAGHGTVIASLIAGNSSGQARSSWLMPLRVLDEQGNGTAADVARAIRYAVDSGADIVCLALAVEDAPALREAADYAALRGVLLVVASGKDGHAQPSGIASLSGSLPNVISVGALDADGVRLPESHRVGQSGAIQLDAPGVAFAVSTDGTRRTWRGASIAAAVASGAAARSLSSNPGLDARQLREVLVATASRPGSASDSSGVLKADAAAALAGHLREVLLLEEGTRLTVHATEVDDRVSWSPGDRRVWINGVGFDLGDPATWTHLVIDGKAGTDSIVLAGSVNGDEYGLLRPGHVSLTTADWFVRGTGFEQMAIAAGDGNCVVDLYDSAGNDALTLLGGGLTLEAGAHYLKASHFRSSRVFASTGNDVAQMNASEAGERLLARPTFTRLVQGPVFTQVNGFDVVSADMRGGFDQVIFEGSWRPESLVLGPDAGQFQGDGFLVNVIGLEQTTSYGHGGVDLAELNGGPQRDVVNAKVLNTLLTGPGYDHRLYAFEQTRISGGDGGSDQLTLHGTALDEQLLVQPGLVRFSGAGWALEAAGFASTLAWSNGGDDTAGFEGSLADDWFWANPDQAILRDPASLATARGFRSVAFDGKGGDDVAVLVDGLGEDRLTLRRGESTLQSAAWQATVRHSARVRARSLVDLPPDVLVFADSQLDYAFEQLGDWTPAPA